MYYLYRNLEIHKEISQQRSTQKPVLRECSLLSGGWAELSILREALTCTIYMGTEKHSRTPNSTLIAFMRHARMGRESVIYGKWTKTGGGIIRGAPNKQKYYYRGICYARLWLVPPWVSQLETITLYGVGIWYRIWVVYIVRIGIWLYETVYTGISHFYRRIAHHFELISHILHAECEIFLLHKLVYRRDAFLLLLSGVCEYVGEYFVVLHREYRVFGWTRVWSSMIVICN